MKVACVIFTVVIAIVIISVCVMVKYATEVTIEERRRNHVSRTHVAYAPQQLAVVTLKDGVEQCGRLPCLAAVMREGPTWALQCFGAVLKRWVVCSAHCVSANATYHVLIYEDFVQNVTQTHAVSLWKVHEKYHVNSLRFDIAMGRVNTYSGRNCHVDDKYDNIVDIGVWRTVVSMDMESYLTNEVVYYSHIIIDGHCASHLGDGDESIFCVELSSYKDCFISEFGPVFAKNKLVGVMKTRPRDCVNKLAMFTNVSYYYDWILQTMLHYL